MPQNTKIVHVKKATAAEDWDALHTRLQALPGFLEANPLGTNEAHYTVSFDDGNIWVGVPEEADEEVVKAAVKGPLGKPRGGKRKR